MPPTGRNSDRRHSRTAACTPPVMQQRMSATTSAESPAIPPGATGCSRSAASSAANNYTHMTLEALMNAPSRESQPHLHPRKINSALWFGVDPEVHKFIRTTWQAYYMGPWSSWKKVPDERKDKWWQAFVQNYYWENRFTDTVYYLWKLHTRTTIGQKIYRRKRDNEKPKFMSDEHWTMLLEEWSTEPALKKSKSASESRKSDPDGKGMHKHCAGPQNFLKIEHDMMVQSGTDEPPAFTELVQKTHTRKDGTFVDARAQALVLETEEAVTQMTASNGSPNGVSQTASTGATSRSMLNQEYIKRGKTCKGHIYGIGSVQYRDFNPSEPVSTSLKRSLDMEMRISSLETSSETVNTNVEGLKADMVIVKEDIAAILKLLQPPSVPAATTTNSHPRVPASVPATMPPITPRTESSSVPASTPTMTQEQQSDLDRWCADLL